MIAALKSRSSRVLLALTICACLFPVCAPVNAGGLGDLLGAAKDKVTKDSDKPKSEKKDTAEPKRSVTNYTGPKKRLAVMDMEVKVTSSTAVQPTSSGGLVSTTSVTIPPPSDFGTGLTEMLTTALIDSGRFIVLERKSLSDVQAEQTLSAGGTVDPATAVPTGKLLGAQAIIRGAVTEYTYKHSSTGGNVSALQGIGLAASKAEAMLVIDVRICDAATGQILDSVKADGKAKASASAIDIDKKELKMSASSFTQSPLGQATRQAIDKAVTLICQRMEAYPWEGRIAEIEKDDAGAITGIYVNAGSRMGLKENDVLEVLHAGRALKDPETGVVIGRTKDKRCGTIRLDTMDKDFSIAVVVEGEGFASGDVVRFPNTGKKAPAPSDSAPPSDPAKTTPPAEPAPSGDAK